LKAKEKEIMQWILGTIGSLIHLIFALVVLATIIISWWLSRKYQERYVEFPWWKTGIILAIEILSWIAFAIFWGWLMKYFLVTAIIAAIIIIIVLMRRRRSY
jgi:hypothetical protein